MNKRHLHHVWRRLKPLNVWGLLIGFVVLSLVSAFALRQNNLTAIKLRDEVLKVDEQNGDVETALLNLRSFVYSHMNADLSSGTGIQHPVQLKYSYERLVSAEKKRVEKANESIYPRAQKYCEKKYPASSSGGPRVPCIAAYVTKNGEKQRAIPDDLYKFDFVSPRWSPDLAGITMLLAAILLLVFIIRFILERWLRYELDEQ